MASSGSRVSSGRDLSSVPEVGDTLGAIARLGFDFLCMPIFHPRFGREFCDEPAQSRPGAHTRSDLLLSGRDWNTLIVGKLSHWIQADSEVKTIRKNSEAALVQELNFAAYLGLPAFMIPLRQENNANLARILLNHIHTGHHSSMLYNEVRMCREKDRDPEAQFEMPYVVRLHNFHQLAEPQACFTFRHPNPDPVIDNNRYCSLRFNVQCNTVLHGFAGYFETNLYKDVTLSHGTCNSRQRRGEGEAEEDRATRSALLLSFGTAPSKEDAAIPLRDDAREPCPGHGLLHGAARHPFL
ncbi:UNVERIFIED_CONTAM: hypothetical protein FKN15_033916 [Acipenser sinensis]